MKESALTMLLSGSGSGSVMLKSVGREEGMGWDGKGIERRREVSKGGRKGIKLADREKERRKRLGEIELKGKSGEIVDTCTHHTTHHTPHRTATMSAEQIVEFLTSSWCCALD
jgi:hypothetical protein